MTTKVQAVDPRTAFVNAAKLSGDALDAFVDKLETQLNAIQTDYLSRYKPADWDSPETLDAELRPGVGLVVNREQPAQAEAIADEDSDVAMPNAAPPRFVGDAATAARRATQAAAHTEPRFEMAGDAAEDDDADAPVAFDEEAPNGLNEFVNGVLASEGAGVGEQKGDSAHMEDSFGLDEEGPEPAPAAPAARELNMDSSLRFDYDRNFDGKSVFFGSVSAAMAPTREGGSGSGSGSLGASRSEAKRPPQATLVPSFAQTPDSLASVTPSRAMDTEQLSQLGGGSSGDDRKCMDADDD